MNFARCFFHNKDQVQGTHDLPPSYIIDTINYLFIHAIIFFIAKQNNTICTSNFSFILQQELNNVYIKHLNFNRTIFVKHLNFNNKQSYK